MSKSNSFSYSKIEVFDQCGFKYFLQYEDGHYTYTSSIATEFGTAIHETEENIAKCIINGEQIDYIRLKNNLIRIAYELEHKYPADFKALDKSGRTYTEKLYYYLNEGIYKLEEFMLSNPTYKIVGVEQEFNIIYKNEYKFHGFIDRIFKDTATNKYILQDIKSWPKAADEKDLTTPLQFVTYSLAIQELFSCTENDITCEYYLPLCKNEFGHAGLTQKAGTAGFMARGIKKLDKLLTQIKEKAFEAKASPLCHWCPFCATNPSAPEESKYLCPYFSHWTREKPDFSKEYEWEGMAKHKTILEEYHYRNHIVNRVGGES